VDDLRNRYKIDPSIRMLTDRTYDLLQAADLAITASGTATLEAALLGTPMIVVYRMHPLTFWIARRLVSVPHVAMANLLAGDRIVPEFLQGEVEADRLARQVRRWLQDEGLRRETRARLLDATSALRAGNAAGKAARLILDEALGCAP
jgi:lipid-A-disaccharide synthase